MPRVAQVVIADVARHVTQRGNGRQFILASNAERLVYLGKPGNVVPVRIGKERLRKDHGQKITDRGYVLIASVDASSI